jgi:hypothetical protein
MVIFFPRNTTLKRYKWHEFSEMGFTNCMVCQIASVHYIKQRQNLHQCSLAGALQINWHLIDDEFSISTNVLKHFSIAQLMPHQQVGLGGYLLKNIGITITICFVIVKLWHSCSNSCFELKSTVCANRPTSWHWSLRPYKVTTFISPNSHYNTGSCTSTRGLQVIAYH